MAPQTQSETAAAALISKLESTTSTPIFCLFSDYLVNFKASQSQSQSQSQIRSLAKQFLPFLNRSLSILPKRLSDPSKLPPHSSKLALELFDVYRLCLSCLDFISSQLSCKPYTLYFQTLRLVYCLQAWGFHPQALEEALRVLDKLRALDSSAFSPATNDAELAGLMVEIVVAIVKCTALLVQSNHVEEEDCRRLVVLVEEVQPWFRVLDASAYEKFHRMLVTYLAKCSLSLVGGPMNSKGDIMRGLCAVTLREYANSSLRDQTYKFARRLCSSLFLIQNDEPSIIIHILKSNLHSFPHNCEIETQIWAIEFVDLVSYCANKCRTASTVFCSTFAECLEKLADEFFQDMTPLDMIIRLYATGLVLNDCVVNTSLTDASMCKDLKDAVKTLSGGQAKLSNLAASLGLLKSFFDSGSHFGICIQGDRHAYLLAYSSVLKFLCQPLADLVNSGKKEIITENDVTVSSMLQSVLEAFHQFGHTYLLLYCDKPQGDVDKLDEIKIFLNVAVAALILSIRTKLKLKKSIHLIKQIIGSDWVHPQGLKYVFASLYNVGVLLYRNKQVNEATKPLKLCCRASWTCLIRLCKMFVQGSCDDPSEDAILEFATEACTRTAFLLDVLNQCGSCKVKKVIVNSLENWSVSEDLHRKLPGPVPLVKQWVKIRCKLSQNMDSNYSVQTLYNLLSSKHMSKRTLGKILEQELLAYEEMDAIYPAICRKMRLKIVDSLLQDVYVTKDTSLQKSMILIRKAWALRACGFECLGDCVNCLSDAISTISLEQKVEALDHGTPASHQLAMAYSLRALCIQEAEANLKQIFQDIESALKIWLGIPSSDYSLSSGESSVSSDTVMLMLFNILDLLSLKGFMELHHKACALLIRLFFWKSLPAEKCLSTLWESRRLSHALCLSPINEEFIFNLKEVYGETCKSVEFWMHCLKESLPSRVGLQQNFSYLSPNFLCDSYKHETSFQASVSVNDVRKAAFELLSRVPVNSHSVFSAGCLYYDLCERLVATGHLVEALTYAKEAHQLRTKLFQEHCTYSVEPKVEKYSEAGEHNQKLSYCIKKFQVRNSVASETWSFQYLSRDMEACYLSPWKILQSYLESTLQVGTIHEMIGNGAEAETLLLWGKEISLSQSLPLFIVSFSSVLGQLYRKKGSWDLSEKELQDAKQKLINSCSFSCLKCKLMLEVTIDQQLGDLYRSFSAKEQAPIERLTLAESFYNKSLDKLNLSEWKNSVSCPEVVDDGNVCNTKTHSNAVEDAKAKKESRRCRKSKNVLKPLPEEQSSTIEPTGRLTRLKYRSRNNINNKVDLQVCPSKPLEGSDTCAADCVGHRQSLLEVKSCMVDLEGQSKCICNKMKCWLCLAMEVKESESMSNLLQLKWEFARRRLAVRVLLSKGKCLGSHLQVHRTHEVILHSISTIASQNTFSTHTPVPTLLLDYVAKEIEGDAFCVERAAILYNVSWFCLKFNCSKDMRKGCCDLSDVQVPKIVSWLMLAFVLCREVPILFQKVSRLLSVIYILSSSSKLFSLSTSYKTLTESHWASYFHQASLGTHINYQFFLNVASKCKSEGFMHGQDSDMTTSIGTRAESCDLPRLASKSFQELNESVTKFFSTLPSTTIVCISLISGCYMHLLQELLDYSSSVCAWLLLSRLSYNEQPIVMLLPINSVSKDDDVNSSCREVLENHCLDRHWHCPWGFTMVDDVAPTFKLILEENYLSSMVIPSKDTKRNRTLWWMRRKKLDCQLGKLLRDIEDSWFGSLRYILLGEQFECRQLDLVHKRLLCDLKSKCKRDINKTLLKVVLGGARHELDVESCVSHLLHMKKGCLIGSLSKESKKLPKSSALAVQLLYEAMNELEEEEFAKREPIILVLDDEVQMLPWENLPTLRDQEVYRMPSVGSICWVLDRRYFHQEQAERVVSAFPFIDPLDAFYLLNPSGDLSSTQLEFESWFKDQDFEGMAGSAPTGEELASALKSHDLFVYFGHGSGAQYISRQEIQKLKSCAATLLMGCSSGSLLLNGCYVPQGTPLSYLLAGSPAIVGNLWEVTDKDIDRFGRSVLDAWLKERSRASCTACSHCKKEDKEAFDSGSFKNYCDHRPKIGSFMSQAREACTLPFLIGASPVCYGVPTGIRRKKNA